MDKKGELTTQQIIVLIILIVSFIVVLFLLFRLNLGETSNKEICHNSVITKSKYHAESSLDCRTTYVCISGGGDCDWAGEFSEVEVNPNNKNEILQAITDEMVDCWWMFGEGEFEYSGGLVSTSVHCALCSAIKFDNQIQELYPEISYLELYDYLSNTEKEEGISYLNYLYNEFDLESLEMQEQFKLDINNDKIFTDQRYSVITGVDNNVDLIFWEDKLLKVYLIPTLETSSKTECKQFITKA